MPRAKVPGAPDPKSRSRLGCWPCKERKVKCGLENIEKPKKRGPCANCQRLGHECDYGIRLNWEPRSIQQKPGVINFSASSISVSTSPVPRPAPLSADLPAMPSSFRQYPTTPRAAFHTPPYQRQASSSHISLQTPPYQAQSRSTSNQPQAQTTGYNSQLSAQSPNSPTLPPAYSFPIQREALENEFAVNLQPNFPMRYVRQREEVSDTAGRIILPLSRSRNTGSATPYSGPSSPATSMPGDSSDGASNHRTTKRRKLGEDEKKSAQEEYLSPLQTSGNGSNSSRGQSSGHGHNNFTSGVSTPHSLHDDRMTVASMLSAPLDPAQPYVHSTSSRSNVEPHQDIYDDIVTYGIDRGIKDRDIPENDDFNALSGSSPDTKREHAELVVPPAARVEFGFGIREDSSAFDSAFAKGGYYESPVDVSIPRSLHPLPEKLLSNKMNMLYFHHFLNHTAKCLLPHNCASNPFRMILPFMAIQDENLMNLFLTYSAIHRCKLLGQPLPTIRIALWMQDVFANLRQALDDPARLITNGNLAAAIMLASLEIISPNAFGVTVPWQSHLDIARQMIDQRGGPKSMRLQGRNDKVTDFLWSWFAYLDVIGSLSGGENSSWLLDYHVEGDTDYKIDCVLGFTSKCIRILAKIAALARICDRERIQAAAGRVNANKWQPSDEKMSQAVQLEKELLESRSAPTTPCTHIQSSSEAAYRWDADEMEATNQAFHWAGYVHLHRRIMGKSSDHRDVQGAVKEIFRALSQVRNGSNAEGCLLFPMFTAGCDSLKEEQKEKIYWRMKRIEVLGMSQVYKARILMEKVWDTGCSWETLVAGEFFG